MAALSNTHASALLAYSLNNGSVPLYIALFTTAPSGGSAGTEISTGGYTRMSITFGSPSMVNNVMTCTNSAEIEWSNFTAAISGVGYWGIFNAQTGGNMLWYGSFSLQKDIAVGDSIVIPIGNLSIGLA